MSENSKIEWTDHTFNPWEGCQKVGPGCDHCYAETRNARFAGGTAINWGPDAPRRRTSTSNRAKPRAWNAAAAEFFAKHGRRQRVFCASLADVFDTAVPVQWRRDLFDPDRSHSPSGLAAAHQADRGTLETCTQVLTWIPRGPGRTTSGLAPPL